jgi:hypothetical protein
MDRKNWKSFWQGSVVRCLLVQALHERLFNNLNGQKTAGSTETQKTQPLRVVEAEPEIVQAAIRPVFQQAAMDRCHA